MSKLLKVIGLCIWSTSLLAQSAWLVVDSTATYSTNATDSIHRSGPVAISHAFTSPYSNKLLVTDKYSTINSRGVYLSTNEPFSGDIGLAQNIAESHNVIVANHYANFKSGINFTDVHTSTAEFNFIRGSNDNFGFDDGGSMNRAAVIKVAGNFLKNGKAYHNNDFDLINMRFFTSDSTDNLASISNFYALRLEDLRGINPDIIDNGWGIYIKPSILKNHFGGMVGIGTLSVTNALTVAAIADPIRVTGLQSSSTDTKLLSIDDAGVVHTAGTQQLNGNFVSVLGDTTLCDAYFFYLHKGPDALYTLPAASSRAGKTWKIVNIGTGTITFSQAFFEGNDLRNSLNNKSGNYAIELFSDGNSYISVK